MSLLLDAKVIKQEKVAPGHFRLDLYAPAIARAAQAGQFVHVRCSQTLDPLLRRPISIHAVEREKGTLVLFYRVAGRGTAWLAERKEDDYIGTLGPLGHGFSPPPAAARVLVLAGGIGIAPLYFLLQELSRAGTPADVFLGAASAEQLFCKDEIKSAGHRLHLATDDGSCGYHGLVTALLSDYLRRHKANNYMVYACGPRGMLKKLTEDMAEAKIRGEVSLEERMGCGVGACLSCACKIRSGAEDGGWHYQRGCVEGPVFPAEEIVW